MSTKIKSLEDRLKEMSHEVSNLEDKVENLENQIKILKENENKNLNEINTDIISKQNLVDQKEKIIKENLHEIEHLKRDFQDLQEKLKIVEISKEKHQSTSVSAERQYKEDILNMRNVIEEKDIKIQNLAFEKENLRYENEKLKQEFKNLESNMTSDQTFFNQISDIQTKLSDKENKFLEEKEQEIFNLKREIESINTQYKKAKQNLEKDINKLQSENVFLKQENEHLKLEEEALKDTKNKIIKLEKAMSEMQNMFAIKKVELTQKENEIEKTQEEKEKLTAIINQNKIKIDILEKELVLTKQSLGDVLNEVSELESRLSGGSTERTETEEKKKKKRFGFFSKKK